MRTDELRHGYTLGDLHDLARLAVHTARTLADASWQDRHDLAWSAIAEELYTADQPPTRRELVGAGQRAILEALRSDRQCYGYYREHTDGAVHGLGSSPAFRAYWWDLCGALPAPSPEGRIVERAALDQIMPMLTPGMREVLLALAVHDTYQDAAAALDMSMAAFVSQIANARRRFRRWWHEGEVPSKPWGCDRRAGTSAGTRRSAGSVGTAMRRRAKARAA